MLKLAHKTITRDASNLCKAKALSILGNLNTSLAFEHAELWQNDQSSTLRTATLAFYAEHGDTNHLNQFQKAMQSTFLQGQDRMAAMLHLNAYLTRIKNPEIRSSGLLLLKNFYDTETHERLVYEYVLGRMIFQLSEELKALDEEIAAYEAAKDFVWVQRLQKERNLLIDVIKKFGE